jgi:magnesium chelatase accessory protein
MPEERSVQAGGLEWHVRLAGEGPALLLLHGTGASSHSWRELIPALAQRFRVVAPDLPGHGRTQMPDAQGFRLPEMAGAIAALLRALGIAPALIAGHSAGAAIALQLVLDGLLHPQGVVAINGAFKPYGGVAAQIFSPMARMLFLNPFVPRFVSWRAEDASAVQRLILGTGSTLSDEGIECYRALFARPDHVAATLGMMAHWDLQPLWQRLGDVDVPVLLIVGAQDRAVSPEEAREVKRRLRDGQMVTLRGLGHLCHEEQPALVVDHICRFASDKNILAEEAAARPHQTMRHREAAN